MSRPKLYIPIAITTAAVVILALITIVRNHYSQEVYTPKPYAYVRIEVPDHSYRPAAYGPYGFELSTHAELQARPEPGERYWANINYPTLNATIHCSYKPVRNDLTALTRDALEFVYKHSQQASAIPEHDYSNPEQHVYGVFFTLEGNTASPYQFILTDSTRHFFRGAVYCNCRPNADSLAPVLDYLREDVIHIMETFRWK